MSISEFDSELHRLRSRRWLIALLFNTAIVMVAIVVAIAKAWLSSQVWSLILLSIILLVMLGAHCLLWKGMMAIGESICDRRVRMECIRILRRDNAKWVLRNCKIAVVGIPCIFVVYLSINRAMPMEVIVSACAWWLCSIAVYYWAKRTIRITSGPC